MTRQKPPVRRIKHTSIHIGDTIRVSGQWHDTTVTRTGTVRKRDHRGGATVYLTEHGVELLEVYRDGTSSLAGFTVTLLNSVQDLTLF